MLIIGLLHSLRIHEDDSILVTLLQPEDEIGKEPPDTVAPRVVVRDIDFIQSFVYLTESPPVQGSKGVVGLFEILF
ncbi:hypothetical protein HG1285_13227 [Hydrogenivirga sp. 128-5-R1-1]|nr:hypothetical protein HG1285_13227 [Hydrogenivirga sp. 128-5-R1-1]